MVLTDVPPQSTVVGIPGKVVRHQGMNRDEILAHANLPDPMAEAIAYLNARVNQLEGRLRRDGKDLPPTPKPACEDPTLRQMLGEHPTGKEDKS